MAAEKSTDDPVERAIDLCVMTQCLIDLTAKQLNGLRTQCRTTEEITQKEICETESKLINLFSKQLVAKAQLKVDVVPQKLRQYPNTQQWLTIVGMEAETAKGIVGRDISLDALLEMTEFEVRRLLERYQVTTEDVSKHNSALRNLKICTEQHLQGDTGSGPDLELHWSSYKSASSSPYGGSSPKYSTTSSHHHQQRPSTSSLPPEAYFSTGAQSPQSPRAPPTPPQSTPTSPIPRYPEHRKRLTPPPTPPPARQTTSRVKFPTTPPPHRKNKLHPDAFQVHPLTKSKSHESQLSKKVNQDVDITKFINKKKPDDLTITGSHEAISQRKRSTDGMEYGRGQISPLPLSPKKSPTCKHFEGVNLEDFHHLRKNQLVVPVSPNTRSNMKHAINHRFQTKMVMGACDLCDRLVVRGKICKECKAKYHRDCAAKAAPACGLPQELLALYLESLSTGEGSPSMLRRVSQTMSLPPDHHMVHATSVPAFQAPDSSSTASSCNSSTPSSPALFTTPPSPAQPSPQIQITTSQFPFPDYLEHSLGSTVDSIGTASSILLDDSGVGDSTSDFVNTNTSNDSDKSDKTLVDTGGSSDKAPQLDRTDSMEFAEDGLSSSWHRVNSISVTLKEWDIPIEELQCGKEIGTGRFGTVCKGNWHGEVAIKKLNTDPARDNYEQLSAFKQEVAMLRKTRHENLVLFMGACMKTPNLAIVTSLCRGRTLYTLLHVHKEKFPLNKVIIVSSQIAQGMGYLHAKEIIHKDLKSKNIFLENGKVVITDFGLFSVTKLCVGSRKGDWLSIPPGWLCYLSPEIMRSLQVGSHFNMDLPFSEASDVYAFGTVWFELICGEWPFKDQPPESIIWQVGKGMKQSLANMHASREVKDFLMSCWRFLPEDRPDYASVLQTMARMPKTLKRLARSPSHPIQLSRSAESVF